jgi:hypothetical protein
MPVERKYERDIDLLLAEEFSVSPAFATWFLNQTSSFSGVPAEVVDVYVSRSDTTGESDLVVIFEKQDGDSRFALHIEDKIDAPLQPEQEIRYRLRAEAEIRQSVYSAFEVILCSPEEYALVHPEASNFDAFVSYESVSEFLGSQDANDLRSAYRATFIATAAKKSSNTWTQENDPVTNALWRAAFQIATTEFPDLEMQPPNFTKGQTWVTFRPLDMPTQPRRVCINAKCDRGYMDLTFSTCLARLFAPLVTPILGSEMYVQQTGKAAAIRIEVPSFKICEPDDAVLTKVRGAFEACVRLIHFYRQNGEILDKAAAASVPPFRPIHRSSC